MEEIRRAATLLVSGVDRLLAEDKEDVPDLEYRGQSAIGRDGWKLHLELSIRESADSPGHLHRAKEGRGQLPPDL